MLLYIAYDRKACMQFLARGKRGIVYRTTYKGKSAVVKEKRSDSTVLNNIQNEAYWLNVLNKKGIGPKLYAYKNGQLVMEYIKGEPIVSWLEKNKTKKTLVRKILKNVLQQCYIMDKLHVEKKEMHRPVKHILIRRNKPVLIDFERCRISLKPSNVTQFAQYLRKINLLKFNKKVLQQYRLKQEKDTIMKIMASLHEPLL